MKTTFGSAEQQPVQLNATVFEDRGYLGSLSVGSNDYEISTLSDPALNVPNVSPGQYRMTRIVETPADNEDALAALGSAVVYFESLPTGDKIALHGGDTDGDGNLLATEGSIRLRNEDFVQLLTRIRNSQTVNLSVEEKPNGMFRGMRSGRVSEEPLNRIRRQTADSEGGITSNPFFWLWLLEEVDRPESVSFDNSSNTQPEFTPGGGSSGGGGASSSLDDPSPVSNPVNSGTDPQLPLIINPFPDSSVVGGMVPDSIEQPVPPDSGTQTEINTSADTDASSGGSTAY